MRDRRLRELYLSLRDVHTGDSEPIRKLSGCRPATSAAEVKHVSTWGKRVKQQGQVLRPRLVDNLLTRPLGVAFGNAVVSVSNQPARVSSNCVSPARETLPHGNTILKAQVGCPQVGRGFDKLLFQNY